MLIFKELSLMVVILLTLLIALQGLVIAKKAVGPFG